MYIKYGPVLHSITQVRKESLQGHSSKNLLYTILLIILPILSNYMKLLNSLVILILLCMFNIIIIAKL